MLALRLIRGAHPAVQLRRLLVTAASAGTGFLLLGALGYALGHPDSPGASLVRLAWCAVPVAATVYLAIAVARTDPGTKPRPGLSAIGLGPVRLMAVSALTTALSTTLGSLLALAVFLHLRGDLTGMPFDGAATEFLAADQPLPLPAALTLLAWTPAIASGAAVVALRPSEAWTPPSRAATFYGRFGAYRRTTAHETFGAFGRFGTHLGRPAGAGRAGGSAGVPPVEHGGEAGTAGALAVAADEGRHPRSDVNGAPPATAHPDQAPEGNGPGVGLLTATPGTPPAGDAPTALPGGLPWGISVVAAGLAVETYASRTTPTPDLTSPGILVGWTLTALGLALAGPGLTHLCGRLLQAARPGALRLLAGRILMTEATRIGRPLGVVCAVMSAMYAMGSLYDPDGPAAFGPLTALGVLLVAGCTVATLLTAAVEARQARADTTAALLRLGAPATTLRSAAALRAGALLAVFGPLTAIVAELAAVPLSR